MSCGVGCRCCLDPTLLWLWCSPAAEAPSQPLAWELPNAAGADLKKNKTTILNKYKASHMTQLPDKQPDEKLSTQNHEVSLSENPG